MERGSNILPLRLVPIVGPELDQIDIPAETGAVIGRSADCLANLVDMAVSRRHCEITRRAGRWFVRDLNSRAGTFLNSLRLTPEEPIPMASGDTLRVAPWTFRVGIGADTSGPATTGFGATATVDDDGSDGDVESFDGYTPQNAAQQRLGLLLGYAERMSQATSEDELGLALLESALSGSGLARAALVKPIGSGEQVQVMATMMADGAGAGEPFNISRSLIREASAGRVATLASRNVTDVAVSIVSMGIHSALCVPVIVDGAVEMCLYMDARESESRVAADSTEFCVALARLGSLALASLKRSQLDSRRRELEGELDAARKAQQLLVPASGQTSGLRYRVFMQPGMFVAGDLFDVVPLDEHRVAVCIGDVTGHGVGAGILMAAAQAHLNAALRRDGDPAKAVAAANHYMATHANASRFVSLWVGVFDRSNHTLAVVDAGHGHWLMLDAERKAHHLECCGGQMLGVDEDLPYESQVFPFPPGSKAVLFSDGIIEQVSPSGDMFGLERLMSMMAEPSMDEPRRIVEEVVRFAGTSTLDDDATASIVEWV